MSTRLIGELFLNGRVFQVSFGQSSGGAKARSIHLAGWLPACEADDGGADAFHAWEIRRFERRRVGDGRVDRADAADRGVEHPRINALCAYHRLKVGSPFRRVKL